MAGVLGSSLIQRSWAPNERGWGRERSVAHRESNGGSSVAQGGPRMAGDVRWRLRKKFADGELDLSKAKAKTWN